MQDLHKKNDLLRIQEMRVKSILKSFKGLYMFFGVYVLNKKDNRFSRVKL